MGQGRYLQFSVGEPSSGSAFGRNSCCTALYIEALKALRVVYQAGALFTHVHFADAPHKLVANRIVSMASACARACDTHTF